MRMPTNPAFMRRSVIRFANAKFVKNSVDVQVRVKRNLAGVSAKINVLQRDVNVFK